MTKRKMLIQIVGGIVGCALFLVVVFYGVFVITPGIHYRAGLRGEKFNSAIWKAESPKRGEVQYTRRRHMIHDLGKSYLHKGMYKSEVKSLLGPPRGLHGAKIMDYWLGYPPNYFTFDHDILEIFLDDADKVTRWKVRNT